MTYLFLWNLDILPESEFTEGPSVSIVHCLFLAPNTLRKPLYMFTKYVLNKLMG